MTTEEPLTIAVLGSGSGSNLQAILDAIDAGTLPARVVGVIADVEDARILDRASGRGIPAVYIDAAPYKTKLDGEAEAAVVRQLQEWRPQVIVLAGFMRIIKAGLLAAYGGRILNIHPALLPAFPGLRAWKQALDAGAEFAGCTVHIVDAGVDTGPIVDQRAVSVRSDDSAESLHARIQEQEHHAYPDVLRRIAEGSLRLGG